MSQYSKTKLVNISRVLKRAYVLLEKGWCQGCSARDSDCLAVSPTSPEAVQFCMTGAIVASTPDNQRYDAFEYLQDTVFKRQFSIPSYNDAPNRRKQTILRKVREAIDRAEQDIKRVPKRGFIEI